MDRGSWQSNWGNPDRALVAQVNDYHARCLDVYKRDTNRVREDAGKERGIAEGGYGRKQIQELVQNAADALRRSPGRVEVVLTSDALYVANQGEPFVGTGVRALLYTHLSNKTGGEIGRFGLGFKSISGISDAPQIFSHSISFEFNRNETARELSEELEERFEPEEVPSLRLAWVLDPRSEFMADPILEELARWAVTMIKVPLKPGAAEDLSNEVAEFDESFNLFASHVTRLDLRDDVQGVVRSISASKRGNRVTLSVEDTQREWLVISREHKPSALALESAGHAARRELVTVSWAVPVTGKVKVGHLCAYFPVKSQVSLSGRLNAPWKLSDDRTNIIECEFNREILADVVPELVVEARKYLVEGGTYGRYIEILPARGRELRSWADSVLNEPVYQRLRESRCLPDLDGQLRSPNSLRRVPKDVQGWSEDWIGCAGNRDAWVHPECTTNDERRSKVDRLMEGNPRAVARVLDWLQAMVVDPTPHKSAVAIELAAGLLRHGTNNAKLDVRDARIVLLENGNLQRPAPGQCFIRTDSSPGGAVFIAPAVTDRDPTREALEYLGITPFEDGGHMLQLLSDLARDGIVDWDALWMAMRGSGASAVRDGFQQILSGKARKLVRVRDGREEWVLPQNLYLAGDHLKQLKEDAQYLIDGTYHAADEEILGLLGVKSRPVRDSKRESEAWFRRYWKTLKDVVGEKMTLGIQARENIVLDLSEPVLGPLDSLPELSSTNRVALTLAVLQEISEPIVRVTHSNMSGQYIAPELWWIRDHGLLPTALGPVAVQEAFVSSFDDDELLRGLLPAVSSIQISSAVAAQLRLRTDIGELDVESFGKIAELHRNRDDSIRCARAYAWWCSVHPENPPEKVWVRVGNRWESLDPAAIAVTVSVEVQQQMDHFGIPCLKVDELADTTNLRECWGFMDGNDVPIKHEYETSAEPVALVEMFDVFDELELDVDPEDVTVQKCLSISKVAIVPGRPEMRIQCDYAREGGLLLVTGGNDREILGQCLSGLDLDDSAEQIDLYLEQLQRKRNSAWIRKVKKARSDVDRLLIFAGEERLRSLIPGDAIRYLSSGSELTGEELAELCITMHGARALEKVCQIDKSGYPITAPARWSGSFPTRRWVRELGFGEEWAGQKAPKRNKPTEYVDGPTELDDLHSYQREVSGRLRQMLVGSGPRRGLITLPTGAGKTRVAVQTIIEAIAAGDLDTEDGNFAGPILWMADGDELCEQAIDTWSFLWRARGRRDTQLVLSRFWANYETVEEPEGVQVVVATWNKVGRQAVENSDFDWLRATPLVIIDEAHGAQHATYRKILDWTGRTRTDRSKLLLGLTATPFRGKRDSDDTKALIRRFHEHILDEDLFGEESAHLALQRLGFLARVRLEPLNGVSIELSPEELAEFRSKYWLPRNAEKRLGQVEERTRMILESILEKPEEWPIVVFAASVENAQTLATLLTLRGRPAASIDMDTSPEDRRSAIERFKRNELRVLTNYNVLSQGFDAPMTRAVYITRPTSSEVRYLQMIGRGLRGPGNNGSDEVLIVNVLDNIVEFGDSNVFDLEGVVGDFEERDVNGSR